MSENTDEKLKPCPFCGGKAHSLTSNGSFLVECSVCLTDFLNGPVGIGWYHSEKDAAAGWNDRPSERALIAQLEAAQGNIKELESKVNHYVAAEYAHKHFDQTPDIIKRADSAELELVKAEAALSAANEKLKGEQVPVAVIVLSKNWPDTGRKVIDYYIEKIQHLPVGTELFTALQKPVVLSSSTVMSRAYVVQAIKAAGFTVEGNADEK
ncbi:TPA: Lar family restriction alleviation protein [Yersinia enterocolitica]